MRGRTQQEQVDRSRAGNWSSERAVVRVGDIDDIDCIALERTTPTRRRVKVDGVDLVFWAPDRPRRGLKTTSHHSYRRQRCVNQVRFHAAGSTLFQPTYIDLGGPRWSVSYPSTEGSEQSPSRVIGSASHGRVAFPQTDLHVVDSCPCRENAEMQR